MSGSASTQFTADDVGKLVGKYSNDGSMSLQYLLDKSLLLKELDLNTVMSFNLDPSIKSVGLNARYVLDDLNTGCSLS